MILASSPICQDVSEEHASIYCLYALKSVDVWGQGQDLDDALIIFARPMPYISHSAIARSIDQPTNLTVVTDSPGTFDELEGQRLAVNQIRVGSELVKGVRVSEDMSVSVMEDDAGVEKL